MTEAERHIATAAPALALGTVQFGLEYGIANRHGKPGQDATRKVLERAAHHGIRTLDTAPAYGEAEALLGRYAPAQQFDLITKTRPGQDPATLLPEIKASLERLQRSSVQAILVHREDDLTGPSGEALWRALRKARETGLTQRIGVSVYAPEALRRILARFDPDLVQLPCNVYDSRFADADMLAECARRGIAVHARSIFLQGLLLMPPTALPASLRTLRPHHERFHAWLSAHRISPLQAALAACRMHPEISALVVGCQSASELDEIVAALHAPLTNITPNALADFALPGEPLINPARWAT